jgi:diguanylate cyclase (GGDEF)-like protein/PAS domain S-box-containing protein
MALRNAAWKIVLAGGLLLVVEYFAVHTEINQNVVYSALGKVSVLGILVGIHLNKPKERLGWYFLAVAMAFFTVGDDITTYYDVVHRTLPFPSLADASYLAGYPFLFAGVVRLTGQKGRPNSREDDADAAIVGLGALALSWQFLMNSYVHDVTLSTFGMLVNVAYPMMDVVLVFIVFRALLSGRARFFYQRLLAASMVVVMAGDFTYDVLALHNAYRTGNFVDGYFLVQYVLLGATALHPSVAFTGAGPREARTRVGADMSRVPVVVLAGFVPPGILLVASAVGASVNVLAISSLSVAAFLVICLRLVWLLQRLTAQAEQITSNLAEMASLEERFRLAFEDNMAPMVFTDFDDRIITANDAFCEMLGYQREELVGKNSVPFTYPEDIGITEASHRRIDRGEVDQARYTKRYVRKDGRVITVEVFRSIARNPDGTALYNVISEREITEERELTEQLSHLALHDTLTGLANRALFLDRLEQAHSRLVREGGMCAVLLLDLDDFKGVNDSFGHVAGDEMLLAVARRLERVARTSDTLSRFGGDEFLYLAEGLRTPHDAEAAASRLLAALAKPFYITGTRVEQRASIGVVVADGSRADHLELIQDADVALYEAKRTGKGSFVVFSPDMKQQAASQFTLAQELRQALKNGELAMHFQPIIDLVSVEVVGFESLMRWHHRDRGWVPPNVFIPIAEQSGLILELGAFALEQAIWAANSWACAAGGSSRPYVTVNLSARQFHDPDLVSTVEDLLARSGLARERLILEITESATLLNVSETMSVLEHLNRLGINFALDDFGTGYSSLSYLALLQPRIIKVDKSFVSPSVESVRNQALLEAIVALGHRLNMTMLAEGVETTAQLERLRGVGCELGQGFLWSAAVAEGEVAELLARPVAEWPRVDLDRS